ncbi:MAG: radical SAM protein [Nitrospirae bacterium]|nr:radical SAM protein [Nitrospirota bacterium]
MLLIFPPVAKPSEPPAGIARLAAALKDSGIRHRLLDANLEGLLYLLDPSSTPEPKASDAWTLRAFRNRQSDLRRLRDHSLYANVDRYKRSVRDLNRALEMSSPESGAIIGLANYEHQKLSPMRSSDLLRAAEQPELNPFFPYFSKRLSGLIDEDQPAYAGFSLNYLSQALCAFAMAGFLRKRYPAQKIILGGGLVTSWMRSPAMEDRSLEDLFGGLVDHFVEGAGESQLLKILGSSLTDCIGTGLPCFDQLPLKDYLSPGLILPYSASVGCYWNRCSFCPEKAEGNAYAPLPVETVRADIRGLSERHKPVLLHLLDNAVSPQLLRSFADVPPEIPWYGFARISSLLTDRDFCLSLKRAGCVMLKLGIESGDQSVLDAMEKGISLEATSEALSALKAAGIATYVYLLFGTPPEGLEEARRTLKFTVRHKDRIDFLNLAIFNMPAGSREAKEFGTAAFYEGDLSLYTDFSHPKGWQRKQVRQFLEMEFKKHPAISAILKNDPPVFTSNHAPFFRM